MVRDIAAYRKKYQGLWEVNPKVPIKDSYSLSLAYTPGVGRSCIEIQNDKERAYELTNKANSIAVISDLSNFPDFETINPLCAIPAVESKCLMYKLFANIDAYPIVLNTANMDEIDAVIRGLMPTFAGFDIDDMHPSRSADLESWFAEQLNIPILYSYRKPNLFLAIERAGLLGKVNPDIVLPALFRGALDVQATMINDEMYGVLGTAFKDAEESGLLKNCQDECLNLKIAARIAYHVSKTAMETGVAKVTIAPESIEDKYLAFLMEGSKSWFEEPLPGYKSSEHDIAENSLEFHRRTRGVIETGLKVSLVNLKDYSNFMSNQNTDEITKAIELDYKKAYELTPKGNLVAVITDGTAVLGYGDIGPEAGLPVMEGKAALFKTLAGVDAVPICLDTKDTDKIIDIISHITPVFGGINLEDIKAPKCFEIENKLIEKLNIPVFHDDQHGTAVVVLAGFINALKLVGKNIEDIKVVVNGAGAGALAVTDLLLGNGVKNLILCDTTGAIYEGRKEGMNSYKEAFALKTNPNKEKGELKDVLRGADFFIGLSVGNIVTFEMVKSMANKPVVFALANPIPEIMPELAYSAGAYVVATGRSDLKNQVNNSLAFPGIFRGTLDVRATRINREMKIAASNAIASLITESELNKDYIIPHALDLRVPPKVAEAVAKAAIDTGVAQINIKPEDIFERTKNYLYEGFLRNL